MKKIKILLLLFPSLLTAWQATITNGTSQTIPVVLNWSGVITGCSLQPFSSNQSSTGSCNISNNIFVGLGGNALTAIIINQEHVIPLPTTLSGAQNFTGGFSFSKTGKILYYLAPFGVSLANQPIVTNCYNKDTQTYTCCPTGAQCACVANASGECTLTIPDSLVIAAVQQNNFPLLQSIADQGANLNAVDSHGNSALSNAIYQPAPGQNPPVTSNIAIVNYLLSKGVKPTANECNWALQLPWPSQQITAFAALEGITQLTGQALNAAKICMPQIQQFKQGLGPQLVSAVKAGNGDAVRNLLTWGADPNVLAGDLIWSINNQKWQDIPSYISWGVNTKTPEVQQALNNQLIGAVHASNLDVTQKLLSWGANANTIDPNPNNQQNTLLMVAASLNQPNITNALLHYGANKNAVSAWGNMTACKWANGNSAAASVC